jgi:serine/threonine protein kinase
MRIQKADRELDVSKYLSQYDSSGTYGVYANGEYPVTRNMFQSESNADRRRCHGLFNIKSPKDLNNLYSVTYPYYTSDLFQVMRERRLSLETVRYGIRHIWQCLAFLHFHHVVHGDVKSNNIAYRKQRRDFVFSDWGSGGIINTPQKIYFQYKRYDRTRKNILPPWYPREIKTVHAQTLKEMNHLLKYIDIFGLMRITIQITKVFQLRELNDLLHFDKQLTYWSYDTTNHVAQFINNLFQD